MSINGINSKIYINTYNSNSNKLKTKTSEISQSDRIEISSLGKSLNEYSLNSEIDNSKKVADIKSKVESSTYSVDTKLTANSLLNTIREGSEYNDR
jgi:negative regulator of flagellin synthesis FlgM